MHRYKLIIFCSKKEDAFIADVPKPLCCRAHGTSQKEALDNSRDAIELWLDTAREFSEPVPKPKGGSRCMLNSGAIRGKNRLLFAVTPQFPYISEHERAIPDALADHLSIQ